MPRQKNGPWPFGPLTATRPWPFVEIEKPAISVGRQDEPVLSYMYGETDGEGEPLYGTDLMASEPSTFKHKPSAGDDSVIVLVDSGASCYYFDELNIPSLEHRLQNYVLLTTPCKILTAGRHSRRDISRPRHRKSRGSASCADRYPHSWHWVQPFLRQIGDEEGRRFHFRL